METEAGFTLLKQGAEARIYKGTYLGKPTLVKERFKKIYRNSDLDDNLTRERIRAESRAIVRCKRAGIRTPALYLVDLERRRIYMEEFQDIQTVKSYFLDQQKSRADLEKVAFLIGKVIGTMHITNVIHGDLTTSNIMVRDKVDGFQRIVLVDFGLSHTSGSAEDKGVDLHVLEKALQSTHSSLEYLFPCILQGYSKIGKVQARAILAKLEEIRARGRKRTMVG